jgi:hypothetical protein
MKSMRYAVAGAFALGLALLHPFANQPAAQVSTWFRANYNNLNEAGTNMYNFANRYAQSATTWTTDHQSTGGWNGTGGAHVVIKGCNGSTGRPCNTAENQFNVGWQTPNISNSFSQGDSAFIRFRIKFDPNSQFDLETIGAKFILWGTTGTSPNSRWIIHLMPALENTGCTLGFNYGYMGWTPASWIWTSHTNFGLSSRFDQSPVLGQYASFASHVNINWSCNPGVLVTRSNHPSPVPKPNYNGAAPVNGWYHLQFQAVSGAAGTADFRTWANNNSQSAPSSERLNMPDGLGIQGWNQGIFVGGYWGIGQASDVGFVIDDFEVGPTFDSNWYPGGGGGGTPTAPAAPTGVRITSS